MLSDHLTCHMAAKLYHSCLKQWFREDTLFFADEQKGFDMFCVTLVFSVVLS